MFSEINQFCKNYYNQIPSNSLKAMGLSAVCTFTVHVAFLNGRNIEVSDLSRAAVFSGIAALATATQAVITPIFNYLFSNDEKKYNPYQELVQLTCSEALTRFSIEILTPQMSLQQIPRFGSLFPSTFFKITTAIITPVYSNLGLQSLADLMRSGCEAAGCDMNRNTTPFNIVT